MTGEEAATLARDLLGLELPEPARAGVAEQLAVLRAHADRLGVAGS